jgi:hypothetical protein
MRTIGEIQAAVQAAVQADLEGSILALSSDELRLCVESQRILLESLRDALHGLVAAINIEESRSFLEDEAADACDVCERVALALKTEPDRWLEEAKTGPKTGFDPKTPG